MRLRKRRSRRRCSHVATGRSTRAGWRDGPRGRGYRSCGWFAVFLLACVVGCGCAQARGAAVWIDTDPAIGSPFREVDDAFALVLAFHSPELRIAGISTTYGNAGLQRTTFVARDLVRRFGQRAGVTESDVYSGAASAGEVRKRTAASDALVRALRKEMLTYVALGPLTNLAAFLEQHPKLADRFERVIFVGGKFPDHALAFGPTGAWRAHDANVFKDPAAARRIAHSNIPLVLAPIETSSRLMLLPRALRRLGQSAGAGEFLYRRSRAWMWFWTVVVREKGGPVFDALAVMAAARPDLVMSEKRFATMDESGELNATLSAMAHSSPVRFCTGTRAGATEFMLERLNADPRTR
jgi:inosine-uridine nucleoside N-ribohydrolase